MNTYPSDEYRSDEDLFQDMEEQLYNPLPSGSVEQDWLDLPEMEQGLDGTSRNGTRLA